MFLGANFSINYVSKIISDPDAIDDTEDEIEISKILRHIDPNIDYYLPIKDYCYLKSFKGMHK